MTITAANIRSQDYKFQLQTSTGTWSWTTRLDVSGSSPRFWVQDIQSPYGLLRDSIPIPGEVIEGMKSSIDQIKANFPPHILVGPPVTLTFDVDEGRGFSESQTVVLTNDGVFGSLLGATLSTSASYVTTTPANVGNLASNESGSFEVAVNSLSLLSVNSPYNETVTVQDQNAGNTPQTLPITINVRPKAVIDLSLTQLAFSVVAPAVGLFPPIPTRQFVIENTGPVGSVLDYQIQRVTGLSDDWLSSFAPVTGTLSSGGTAIITVAVAPIEGLARGTYQESLRVSGYSANSYVDILIQLVIS